MAIADVRLLCRLVLTLEALISQLEKKDAAKVAEVRRVRQNLPAVVTGFIKELLPLGDSTQRQRYIHKYARSTAVACCCCWCFRVFCNLYSAGMVHL